MSISVKVALLVALLAIAVFAWLGRITATPVGDGNGPNVRITDRWTGTILYCKGGVMIGSWRGQIANGSTLPDTYCIRLYPRP